jgi:hypothetical protein
MPKQHRWELKRSLDQSLAALTKAQNYIILIGNDFEPYHPEFYEAFCRITQAIDKIKEAVIEIRDEL